MEKYLVSKKLDKLLIISVIFLTSIYTYSQSYNDREPETLYIPVVIHIITSEQTPQERKKINNTVKYLINSFNDKINFNFKSKILKDFHDDIGIPNIKLYLPKYAKDCSPIESISWHKAPFFPAGAHVPIIDDIILKKYNYMNPKEFLNIWLIDLIDFDWKLNLCGKKIIISNYDLEGAFVKRFVEGITLDIDDYNEFLYNPSTIIHEVGHYLGLRHIWGDESGCKKDDGISDTPRQKTSHLKHSTPQISCEGGYANHQNYMDYGNGLLMFTKEQVKVMRNNLKNKRKELLWQSNCSEATNIKSGYVKDSRDNQKYKWVQIGSQKWMAENLNYSSKVSTCYDKKNNNCSVYGRLYNWNEAINVCPKGWRLPNKNDWDKLIKNIGRHQPNLRSKNGWTNNRNGTDKYGFNLYPSGYINVIGRSVGQGSVAKLWLSNQSIFGYSRTFNSYNYKFIPTSGSSNKKEKLSCRCIQDVNTPSETGSVLNKEKLRTSMGYRIDTGNEFDSPIPFKIKGFFNANFNERYSIQTLERLGLKFLGKGKFRDIFSSEIIQQKDIYERININRAKELLKKNPTRKTNGSIIYNTNNYILYIKLINTKTNKIIEKRVGDKNQHGILKIPNGTYILETSFRNVANKKHNAHKSQIAIKGNITNILVEKNLVVTIKTDGKVIFKSQKKKNKTFSKKGKVW